MLLSFARNRVTRCFRRGRHVDRAYPVADRTGDQQPDRGSTTTLLTKSSTWYRRRRPLWVGSGNSQRRRQMAAFLKQTDRSNELLGLIVGSVVRLGSMRWIDAFAAGRCYSLLTMHSDAGVTFETRESVR